MVKEHLNKIMEIVIKDNTEMIKNVVMEKFQLKMVTHILVILKMI